MKRITSIALCISILVGAGASNAAAEKTNEEVARELALLMRASRAVISKSQAQINRTDVGDKGVNADAVLEQTRKNFLESTGVDLTAADAGTREGALLVAFQSSIREVMDNANR